MQEIENDLNRAKRIWTEKEIEELRSYWGFYSIPAVAKKMKRSPEAIKKKAYNLGLGPMFFNSDLISLSTLLKEFKVGSNHTSYVKRLTRAGLKIRMVKIEKRSYRMVNIDDFWVFMEKNPNMLDFSKLELNALGKEPDWVKNVRKEQFEQRNLLKKNDKWTKEEDAILISLLKTYQFSYADIARKLKRSEYAIGNRLRRLGVKERAIPTDNTLWTNEEIEKLKTLIKQGKSYDRISIELKKTVPAVRGKVRRLYPKMSKEEIKQLLETSEINIEYDI